MRTPAWIPALLGALVLMLLSVFVVREGESALVLNLGKVVRSDIGPGLHFKLPLIETARVFDRRLQILAAEPERYLTSEKKDVSVDFFAIGRISNVRDFYRATNGDETVAQERLAPIIKDALRNEINAHTLQEVVSGDRAKVLASQLAAINQGASTLGVQISDIRIKRIDLPAGGEVIAQVYRRMSAQRKQVASQLRAEGEEQKQKIESEADRQSKVLLAEAERDAQKLRGEGDAEATRLYADAANRDPSFFAFQRSLDAYRKAFASGDNVIVLERNDPFLQYMRSDK